MQSPPSTSGRRPAACTSDTRSATSAASSTTRSRSRTPSTGGVGRCRRTARSPVSSTSTPAARRASTSPAARSAAGAFSWPALCEPAVVGTPITPMPCVIVRGWHRSPGGDQRAGRVGSRATVVGGPVAEATRRGALERWRLIWRGWRGWLRWSWSQAGWSWSQAGWSGRPGDARGCGDVQGAVPVQGEPPAGGEGLEPVVGAAQAAQVGAVGGSTAGVGGDVVQVGPAGALPAVGDRQRRSRTARNARCRSVGA